MKLSSRTFIMENAAPKGIPYMKVTDFQVFVNTILLISHSMVFVLQFPKRLAGSGYTNWVVQASTFLAVCILMGMTERMYLIIGIAGLLEDKRVKSTCLYIFI